MQVDGWAVRIDDEGNFLKISRERPKTHYIITLLKQFAIDIELDKQVVDDIPQENKQATLMDIMRSAIKEADNKMPMEIKVKTREIKCPIAYLFSNGNAAFFNEYENQIYRFQTHGWKGLHWFLKEYPNAPVIMQLADPIHPDVLPYLLANIKEPEVSGS